MHELTNKKAVPKFSKLFRMTDTVSIILDSSRVNKLCNIPSELGEFD